MPEADLLVTGLDEVATPTGPLPVQGEAMADLRVIEDAAVAFREGQIHRLGPADEVADAAARERFEVDGGTLVPGFVDAHTHLVWAGDRADELVMKLAGKSYEEILAAGGGIHSTVQATRAASPGQLVEQARARLDRCLGLGTTTMEAKGGYALTVEGELELLRVLDELDQAHPVDVVATVLGAHAIPEDVDRSRFVDEVAAELTPRAAKEGLAEFCDAFVDEGAFTVEEGRRVLEAGRAEGLDVRVHADELARTGAARVGLELEAASLDHLNRVTEADVDVLAEAAAVDWDGVATLCPVTPFTSDVPYPPARDLVDAGVPVALGSDLNPNAWSEGMWFTLALAVHELGLRPAEAVTAATANAAASLNRHDRGRLEEGLLGDAVLLDVPSHTHVGYRMGGEPVKAVFKRGQRVA
jgi:imidazolonepropionase